MIKKHCNYAKSTASTITSSKSQRLSPNFDAENYLPNMVGRGTLIRNAVVNAVTFVVCLWRIILVYDPLVIFIAIPALAVITGSVDYDLISIYAPHQGMAFMTYPA